MSTPSIKLIYIHIKGLIPSGYKVSFGMQDIGKLKSIGVFFKGGVPEKRIINGGEYVTRKSQITLNIVSENTEAGVYACMAMLEGLQKALNTTHDIRVSEDTASVQIQQYKALGDINQLGVNPSGVPVFSLNYTVFYN